MILDEILTQTRADILKRKEFFPFSWLQEKIASTPYQPKNVKEVFTKHHAMDYKIIAEVKKASPSKGVICENFIPISIAKEYQNGGASAISVLTEEHFFLGNLEYLSQIRKNCSLPILRKDFIVDSYQILEALAFGADFILLIAKVLDEQTLENLLTYAHNLNLEALVEIHDREDLDKALRVNANILGINHRNLEDFSMDMDLCHTLIPHIPKDKIIIAESGLSCKEQLEHLSKMGVNGFLIGEYFMRQNNIAKAVSQLLP